MKIRFCHSTIVLICLLTLSIIGCGSDDEDAEPANSAPIVDSFIVPTEFNPGDVFDFSVVAYDKDGDPLSYTWEVDAGELNTTTGTNVKWTAPEDVESVKVTVYVSDGVGKSTKRVKRITNQEFIPPDPPEVIVDDVPDPPLNLIVPGKGAFGVKLGDPFKKVENIHGEPDEPPDRIGFFSYWNPDIGLAGFVDGIDLVEHLFLSHPNKAKTAGGNGIGTNIAKLENEYGRAEEIDNDGGRVRHWYWKRGIEFAFDEDARVESVFVFKPIDLGDDIEIRPQQPIKNEAKRLERLIAVYQTPTKN